MDEMLGYKVISWGQKDLQDDGRRSFDEVICAHLDANYCNWRDPGTTIMVPPTFPSTNNPDIGEKTEKDFFSILEQFGKCTCQPMFVIHSYKFNELICEWESGYGCLLKWVTGEHDFVAVHQKLGVVFFQVKATKTHGRHQKAEEQIRKDKVSLMKFFQRMASGGMISKKEEEKVFFINPAFIVLPNSRRGQSVCAQDNVIFQEDCVGWEAFSTWWEKFVAFAEHPGVNQTMYEYLVMRFVGMVHASPLLGPCVDTMNKTIIIKTKRQMDILGGNYPPKLWITGPAGSGKTMLLLEKAVTLARNILEHQLNEKILIVCFNSVLCKHLEATLKTQLVTRLLAGQDVSFILHCTTFAKLVVCVANLAQAPSQNWEKEAAVSLALRQLSTQFSPFYGKYDHILVDEGQDLYGRNWPQLLEQMHKSSVVDHKKDAVQEDLLRPSGYFWVMFDTNQYLYFSKEDLQLRYAHLRGSAKLNKVLRNTGNVFKQSKKYFESLVNPGNLIVLGHQEDGLPIKWDDSLPSRMIPEVQGVRSIVPHVTELRREGVRARDICILVETVEKRFDLKFAFGNLNIKTQTAENLVMETADLMVVESIRCFKGLESKVIILYNPRFECGLGNNERTKEMLYTAVSRCVCYLIVITTQAGCIALKSDQGIQEASFDTAQGIP